MPGGKTVWEYFTTVSPADDGTVLLAQKMFVNCRDETLTVTYASTYDTHNQAKTMGAVQEAPLAAAPDTAFARMIREVCTTGVKASDLIGSGSTAFTVAAAMRRAATERK